MKTILVFIIAKFLYFYNVFFWLVTTTPHAWGEHELLWVSEFRQNERAWLRENGLRAWSSAAEPALGSERPARWSTRWHLGGKSTQLSLPLLPSYNHIARRERELCQGEKERKRKACRHKNWEKQNDGMRKSPSERRGGGGECKDNVAGGFLWSRVWVHVRMRPNSH